MAALAVAYVSSLQYSCLRAVAEHVQEHQKSLHLLPNEVKDKLVKLFSKRGLLNDEILEKVNKIFVFFKIFQSSNDYDKKAIRIFMIYWWQSLVNNLKNKNHIRNFFWIMARKLFIYLLFFQLFQGCDFPHQRAWLEWIPYYRCWIICIITL